MVSFKISLEIVEKMMNVYQPYQEDNEGDYVSFYANIEGTSLTIYQSKKGYKAFFMGKNALNEARKWAPSVEEKKPKQKVKEEWLSYNDQIGSDEVGVGDLLLPLVVVAAYVKKSDIEDLISMGVHDSKKLSDEEIIAISPTLIRRFHVSKLTLPNSKYNEMIDKGENLNSLKARMHNQALINVHKKYPRVKEIYVDQFCLPQTYYRYLKNDREIESDIFFHTKGESYYPCVALASVLARYSMLIEKKKLEEKYHMAIPFGAGKKADEFVQLFIKKYGKEELNKIVKKNFANVREVLK